MNTKQGVIRVILIDDQSTIHMEVGALLAILDGIELVAQGSTGREAVLLCDEYKPDIVLMDIGMPVMNGIDATRIISSRHPQIRIIAMTGMDDKATVQQMLAAGAAGYILKETRPDELSSILRTAYAGKSIFSSEVVKTMLEPSLASPANHDYGLTRREIEILRFLAEGRTNPQIAVALTVSQATVKFHIANIFRKLDVDSRAAAIALATKQGLI